MANGRGVGYVLGIKVKGVLTIILHYIFCSLFSANWQKRLGLLLNLLFKVNDY
jgi:hypothetical protein